MDPSNLSGFDIQHPIEHGSRYYTSQTYLLPSDEIEAQRLRDQQKFVTELFEDRLVIAPAQLAICSSILDIGTGSGAWALDLVNNYPNADAFNIICLDIGSRLFPTEFPSNVTFKIASVLSLPAEWENKFDLVHQRLLIAGLKYDEWPTATKEIFRVTAPGGWAQLCEVDSESTICGPSSAEAVELVKALYTNAGTDLACSGRIPTLLAEAGFSDVRVERRVIKFGHWGGDTGIRCANNLIGVWRGFKTPILRAGGFGMVKDEEEFDGLMDQVKEEWDTRPGAEFGWVIVFGKKPVL